MFFLVFVSMCPIFSLLINPIQAYAFNQPKFCSNATWKVNATTFAGGDMVGCGSNVVMIDKNNTIYLTIGGNNRFQIWFDRNFALSKNFSSGLSGPQGLFVKENGDIFIDNGANGRVEKWTLSATSGVSVMTVSSKCFSLFVDKNNTLYCMQQSPRSVVKRSLNSSSLSSTAVTGATGFSNAHGIFVDLNFNLYIADYAGNQIKCVASGTSSSTTVVGSSASAPRNFALNGPIAVMLDGSGYFFILEHSGNRLVAESSTGFRCIVGCSGTGGGAANQLQTPYSFSFDTDGNIYVSDQSICRFQKFFIQQNNCETTTTIARTSSTTSTTSTSTSTTATTTTTGTTSTSSSSSSTTSTSSTTSSTTTTSATSTTTTSTSSTSTTTTTATTTTSTTSTSTTSTSTTSTSSTSTSTTTTTSTTSTSTSSTSTTSTSSTSTSTTATTSTTSTSTTTTSNQSLEYFIPITCSSSKVIGTYCNTSNLPCNNLQSCLNDGTCIDNNNTLYGYTCACLTGFNGEHCELDHRLCTPTTCWNNGICQEILNLTFECNCTNGYQGNNCETKVNYCEENSCLNGGVCRPLLSNYTCICLSGSYSGQYCEIVENSLAFHQTLAKSFSYVAMIAISVVVGYFITMDVLKYVFGIDPIKPIQRKKRKKHKVTIIRFIYVNPKSNNIRKQPIYTIEGTIA